MVRIGILAFALAVVIGGYFASGSKIFADNNPQIVPSEKVVELNKILCFDSAEAVADKVGGESASWTQIQDTLGVIFGWNYIGSETTLTNPRNMILYTPESGFTFYAEGLQMDVSIATIWCDRENPNAP